MYALRYNLDCPPLHKPPSPRRERGGFRPQTGDGLCAPRRAWLRLRRGCVRHRERPDIGLHPRESEPPPSARSEEHTSELQSLMRISYAVFCLKKKKNTHTPHYTKNH